MALDENTLVLASGGVDADTLRPPGRVRSLLLLLERGNGHVGNAPQSPHHETFTAKSRHACGQVDAATRATRAAPSPTLFSIKALHSPLRPALPLYTPQLFLLLSSSRYQPKADQPVFFTHFKVRKLAPRTPEPVLIIMRARHLGCAALPPSSPWASALSSGHLILRPARARFSTRVRLAA